MISGRKIKYLFEDKKAELATKLADRKNKFALITAAAVLAPLLLLLIFFYGGFNFSKITSVVGIIFQQESEIEKDAQNSRSDLKLISRDDFLKKYNPKPAFLPQAIEIHSSLAEYIRSNSTTTLLPARNWSVPFIDINAESAIAIDMPSNRILYGKNVFAVRPIASITKLMTALIAVENMNLSDVATVSQNAIRTEGSSASLVTGEELTIEQLLYAALLESSNDAAVAIGEFYDSTRPEGSGKFVDLMNQRAEQLALKDTSFIEPSGLDAGNQTTSFGVANILWVAFQNETLRVIMGTSTYTTGPGNREFTHSWVNLNTLVGAYEDILAGKTGYTEEAGPSMALLSATSNPDKYIVVVVLSAQDRIDESTNLLNWVRQAYIWED